VTIALTGITGLVQPERLRDAATVGSCRSFAPGGCNASIGNNAQNAASSSAANNALLAQILAFLQALQALFMVPILAGVNLINTKLGPVMAGVNGIGGFLARTAEAAKLDKVLNAMNTVLLLHNAAMLSRNLGSTLGDLTSQVLTTIGIKDSEGAGIDVNEILGKQANSFMASLLGAEVWAGTKTSWNKASSIISSATNLMYTMRSIFDSTREILEWTAENTGKIGNALKRFRIVGENAYKWLPERVTVQNSFTRKLDRFREGVDDLDDAASSLSGVLGEVQSIQQEYADLQEQKQKFEKNISELTPKPRDENKPVSDAVTAAKTVSAAPPGIENVFRGEGEKIDD
jgi:lysophospholipase L1-like esterase